MIYVYSLGDNDIKDEGVAALATVLRNNVKLKAL